MNSSLTEISSDCPAVHPDPNDPTHFALYETWRDRKDFETVQMKRSYRRKYEETLDRLLERTHTITFQAPT